MEKRSNMKNNMSHMDGVDGHDKKKKNRWQVEFF